MLITVFVLPGQELSCRYKPRYKISDIVMERKSSYRHLTGTSILRQRISGRVVGYKKIQI